MIRVRRFWNFILVAAGLMAASVTPAAAAQLGKAITPVSIIQIPLQPLADSSGRPLDDSYVLGSDRSRLAGQRVPITTMNEPVWTRTCDRGHGLEIWNNTPATSCAGTMHYYYYNVEKKRFNMAAFLAAQGWPNRGYDYLMSKLDPWCSAHTFQCTVVVAAAFFGATVLFK